jgi:lipopolysaccharide export system permease protein
MPPGVGASGERMTILDLYVLRKHVGPFLFSVATITFIFVMRALVDFLDLFATRDLGIRTILEMFVLSLGWIFALTFPMAVLVAVVMTFGRLAQDSELDAMHAGGISFLRVLAPVGLASLVLTAGLFYYNNAVLPDANHRLKNLRSDIQKTRPTIAIREGVFMDEFEGYRILVDDIDDVKGIVHGVTIYVLDPREPTRTINAPWGELLQADGGNALVIRLHDGEIHEVDKEDRSSYFLLNFETHDLIFDDLGTKLERRLDGGIRGDRELPTSEMLALTRTLEVERAADADSLREGAAEGLLDLRRQVRSALQDGGPEALRPAELPSQARILLRKLQSAERRVERKTRDINRYAVEIHKKYAFPVACFVFVLLGAPLGARMRRGGAGVGGGVSFLFFLVYYMASLGGEKLGDRGFIPPALGMWGINVVLGVWGLVLVLGRDARLGTRRSTA